MMVGLTVTPVLGQAQTGADSVPIVEAAARWYASRAPNSSRVAFILPRGPRSDPAPTARQLEAAQRAAEVLHATLIPLDSQIVYLCDRNKPESCGPGQFDLIVNIRVLSITGNASEVLVSQLTPGLGSSGRSRTSSVGWQVLFVRTGDRWVFNRILVEAAS
jgi:hypothetical protein